MKLSFLIPGAVLLLALAALVVWLTAIDVHDLQARIPRPDASSDAEGAGSQEPLVGTLTAGTGKPAALAGSWPRFRGSHFDGIAHDTVRLARSWPASGPAVLWSCEVCKGFAGPAVRDGRVYLLDYDEQEQADTLRCLSLADGEEIWRYSYPVKIKDYHGITRTVPAVSDQYVVTLGPKCQIMCLDAATGECHWLKDLVRDFGATVPDWYAGQCPLIDGDRAIFAPGGDALLIALDCKTGEVVPGWNCPNPRGWNMTHSSIIPMEFAGRKMYVYCGSGGVAGISADDGSLLWDTTDWKISMATSPSPVVLPEGRLFFCGDYGAGAAMMQLKERGGKIEAETVFRLKPNQFGTTQQTPIFYDGHLFGTRKSDGRLVCLDLEGNEVWKNDGKMKFEPGPYLVADDLIFILSGTRKHSGWLTVAEATPEGYRPLAQAQVIDDAHESWAPMALAAGRLLVRDMHRMICIDVAESLPQPGEAPAPEKDGP